uniref:Ring finger protein 41, like n=1 Tax=Erpetoichthys calabaricus TaxID=27687 RepID=A0A8C4REP3_ERPCA
MGYDIERFVGYVNEGLLCCICQDVLENPLQAPCEHAFCSTCIHGWLVHHHICPEDRQSLDVSVLWPLFRYMKNDLNQLQIQCRNREHGCNMVCSLESIELHEWTCINMELFPLSSHGAHITCEFCNFELSKLKSFFLDTTQYFHLY